MRVVKTTIHAMDKIESVRTKIGLLRDVVGIVNQPILRISRYSVVRDTLAHESQLAMRRTVLPDNSWTYRSLW